MEKNTELKLNNLISLRTSLIAVVTVLTGGLFGYASCNVALTVKIIVIIIGIYIDILLLNNAINTNENILKILKEGKNGR